MDVRPLPGHLLRAHDLGGSLEPGLGSRVEACLKPVPYCAVVCFLFAPVFKAFTTGLSVASAFPAENEGDVVSLLKGPVHVVCGVCFRHYVTV
jgi:hypothetical protein